MGRSAEKIRGDAGVLKENGPPQRALQRARQRYTDAELDALRRDKLCFTCKAPCLELTIVLTRRCAS